MTRSFSALGFGCVLRPQSHTADLIFLHGLNGHRSLTWTSASGEFWLPWLEKDLPDVRVWTYGYDADAIFGSRDALDIHAAEFLDGLLLRREGNGFAEKHVVFVAHSLGGILVKKAMIRASSTRSEWNSIFRKTVGIVFLGTPHRGSSSANRASSLIRFILCRSPPPLLQLLSTKSSLLVQIAERFNNIWGQRRIYSFCETNPTSGFMIVPRKDAITNCQEEHIYDILNCNHKEICKPDSAQSDLFTKILHALQSLLQTSADSLLLA